MGQLTINGNFQQLFVCLPEGKPLVFSSPAMKLWNGFARWSPRLEGNVVMFQVHCRLLLSVRFIMICLGNIWEYYRLLLLFLQCYCCCHDRNRYRCRYPPPPPHHHHHHLLQFLGTVEPTSKLENISRPVTWSRGYQSQNILECISNGPFQIQFDDFPSYKFAFVRDFPYEPCLITLKSYQNPIKPLFFKV